MNAVTLEDMVQFHHRKEAISDIRFSPGRSFISLQAGLSFLSRQVFHFSHGRSLHVDDISQRSRLWIVVTSRDFDIFYHSRNPGFLEQKYFTNKFT